ncbi:DUF2974 domain-containing protein [Legionella sp. PATHC038]|uniref:lipase family protein n=1 Tax=Legionella sheltonii TaxID=2992041 RepID=UPI0022432267|nr:Mbeg1-like protein [Legionella sp. PATHC038]MCW8398928.1 DUF2974 domain-containing protein [Legionella sp. PATHC038]
MPKCNLGLLLSAAHLVYRVVGENNDLREEPREGYVSTKQLTDDIAESGYEIAVKTNAQVKNSNGLTAVRLEPKDNESPIIISFRGTDSMRDVFANMNLMLTGTVGKKLQEEAFSFYTKTKEKYPNREIILVGHSLGGHLAQYVGARAYDEDSDLKKSRRLHVRTFNTAPVDSFHGRRLYSSSSASVFNQFCNYRLESDTVSRTSTQRYFIQPVRQYYGNTYSFRTDKNTLAAHPLRAMREVLPDSVKNLEIGGTDKVQRDLNTLKEAVIGVKEAYAVHIKGQWFSKYRMGSHNKINIDKALDKVTEALNETPPNFKAAEEELESAQNKVRGPTSQHCLQCLLDYVHDVQRQDELSKLSKLASEDVQATEEQPSTSYLQM